MLTASSQRASSSDDDVIDDVGLDGPDDYADVADHDDWPDDFVPTELVRGRHGWEHRPMPAARWAQLRCENIAAANDRKRRERAQKNSRPSMRASARRSGRRHVRRAVRRQTSGSSRPSAPPGPYDGSPSSGAA